MGEDDDLAKEASVLNRIVRWHPRTGITREADPRHAEMISRGIGAEELKTISTRPQRQQASRQDLKRAQVELDDDDGDTLSSGEVTRYRRIAARANLLAEERMDMSVCYKGSDEANDGVHQRRLEQTRQAAKVNWYKYRFETEQFIACTGSDWAGCRRTRKSTSGGCIHRRHHMLKFGSKTQAVVAVPWTLWVARAPRFCARIFFAKKFCHVCMFKNYYLHFFSLYLLLLWCSWIFLLISPFLCSSFCLSFFLLFWFFWPPNTQSKIHFLSVLIFYF